MKIQKVRIENYKSIADVTFEFANSYGVIVGPNDHGKTNILCAIRDLFTFDFVEGQNRLVDPLFVKKRKRRDSGASPLRLSFLMTDLPKGLLHTRKRLNSVSISLHFMADGSFRCSFNTASLDQPKRLHSKKALQKYLDIRAYLNVVYVPTFRNLESHLGDDSEEAALFNLISNQLMNMMETQQGGTTAAYRTINTLNEKIETLVKRSFKDIEKQVSGYLPSSSKIKVDFGFLNASELNPDKYLSKIIAREVFIKNKIDGTKISELGSGIQQAVLIGLLERNLIKTNKTNILLFEEPESFLHPSAQRELFLKLVNLSKRPATQIIFSTHSAAIVDSADLTSIIVVKKKITKAITEVFPFTANSKSSMKDFARLELEKTFQNSEIFFSELIVLVEGRSDQLVLREAIRKIEPEIYHKITIVDIGGVSNADLFINFITAFRNQKDFAFKWILIADKDVMVGTCAAEIICSKISMVTVPNWPDLKTIASKNIPSNSELLNRNIANISTKRINRILNQNNIIINAADIEYMIIDERNFARVKNFLITCFPESKSELEELKNPDELSKNLGSKGPNLDWIPTRQIKSKWKRPYIVKSIVCDLEATMFSSELRALVEDLKSRIK